MALSGESVKMSGSANFGIVKKMNQTHLFYPYDNTNAYNFTMGSWAVVIAAASKVTGGMLHAVYVENYTPTPGNWSYNYRSQIKFDTSSLSGLIIISAKLKLRGYNKDDYAPYWTPNVNIYGSDYTYNGSLDVPFSSPIAYADWKTGGADNVFVLNAAGLAAINKIGITMICTRNVNYDIAAYDPKNIAGYTGVYDGLDRLFFLDYYDMSQTDSKKPLLEVVTGGGSPPITGFVNGYKGR